AALTGPVLPGPTRALALEDAAGRYGLCLWPVDRESGLVAHEANSMAGRTCAAFTCRSESRVAAIGPRGLAQASENLFRLSASPARETPIAPPPAQAPSLPAFPPPPPETRLRGRPNGCCRP